MEGKSEAYKAIAETVAIMRQYHNKTLNATIMAPAMTAYEQGQITADEYTELAGEPYAATAKAQYVSTLEYDRQRIICLKAMGLITEAECADIIGSTV